MDSNFYPSLGVNPKSIIRHSERLTKNNFICRRYYFPPIDLLFLIHWGIGEQVSHSDDIELS